MSDKENRDQLEFPFPVEGEYPAYPIGSVDMNAIESFTGKWRFLSNFSDDQVEIDLGWGLHVYQTAEHAYQAAKSIDELGHDKIRDTEAPGKAKYAGRTVKLRPNWDNEKGYVMGRVIRAKLDTQKMRQQLLSTEDRPLIEGNYWHDNLWGNCVCPRCGRVEGQNWLGRILMKVREEIRKEEEPDAT